MVVHPGDVTDALFRTSVLTRSRASGLAPCSSGRTRSSSNGSSERSARGGSSGYGKIVARRQAACLRLRIHATRPPKASTRPGKPAPTTGPGTAEIPLALNAFVNARVLELPPAAPTKSIWSVITNRDGVGVKGATVLPGAFKARVTPLLRTSDTCAWPDPVVVPASAKN